jgi:hypothetical protein
MLLIPSSSNLTNIVSATILDDKTFDFSKDTIRQLIQEGYEDTKE